MISKPVIISFIGVAAVSFFAGRQSITYRLDEIRKDAARQQAIAEERVAQAYEATEAITKEYKERLDEAERETERLIADVADGKRRLSVAVRACQLSGNAGNEPDEGTAELDPETAGRVIRITADGDSAIRKLNACIDQYNAVKAAINKEEKQ
ncbi:MAG: lysis system i-spanin subunit Rz [Paraprevotella sp.]|nr:lysis system i-spanin subunit Rz [Paraprevotella sp.]